MPICCDVDVVVFDQQSFYDVDKEVMRLSFDIHNEFGPLCDEAVFRAELARRYASSQSTVHQELQIRVTHESFCKHYYVDMLVNSGIIYELKNVAALLSEHESQLINYLLLLGLRHGKLLNYGARRLEYRFVSTRLTPERRHCYPIDEHKWSDMGSSSHELKLYFFDLLADWGAFLHADLYRQALVHFLGGTEQATAMVKLKAAEGCDIGHQRMVLIGPRTALHLSTATRNPAAHQNYLKKMLVHTDLQAIQWINMNHHHITLKPFVIPMPRASR